MEDIVLLLLIIRLALFSPTIGFKKAIVPKLAAAKMQCWATILLVNQYEVDYAKSRYWLDFH